MAGKAVISLTTGLEDSEKVTVAFLVAVGAAESNRPTLMFLTKEAVRLAVDGTAVGVAAGLPSACRSGEAVRGAGGKYYVCPICFNAKHLDPASLIAGAELQGTIPMWGWIGDEGATRSAIESGGAAPHCMRGMRFTERQTWTARPVAARAITGFHRVRPEGLAAAMAPELSSSIPVRSRSDATTESALVIGRNVMVFRTSRRSSCEFRFGFESHLPAYRFRT